MEDLPNPGTPSLQSSGELNLSVGALPCTLIIIVFFFVSWLFFLRETTDSAIQYLLQQYLLLQAEEADWLCKQRPSQTEDIVRCLRN